MLICSECKKVFDEEELKVSHECIGEYWGAPAYTEIYSCPVCGSTEYTEAVRCKVCGDWFEPKGLEDECSDCMEDLSWEWKRIQETYNIDYETLQDWIVAYFGW